jgi:hypothetical protein
VPGVAAVGQQRDRRDGRGGHAQRVAQRGLDTVRRAGAARAAREQGFQRRQTQAVGRHIEQTRRRKQVRHDQVHACASRQRASTR